MQIGKLSNEDLQKLVLSKFHKTRPESLSVPSVGEDCALLNMGQDYIVMSMDPITAASYQELGQLSVHVNCNDAVCAGAEPVGLLVTLLVPPDFAKEGIAAIAESLSETAQSIHVDILGGHTEITDAVTRPITCTAVIARKKGEGFLPGLQEGDAIVMSKFAALEGTSLLYHSGKYQLSDALAEQCQNIARMLSVVKEGSIAMEHQVHAMHDVTEGGVLGAIWEMAYAAQKGICLDTNAISLLPATVELCKQAEVDPLRLIGSGSLLMACPDGEKLVDALRSHGISAAVIGICKGKDCVDQTGVLLQPPQADAVYKGL